jgi:hypothetical protein
MSEQKQQGTNRKDGTWEFSRQSRAIADRRTEEGSQGRIARALGSGDIFTEEFKSAFQRETEYEQILGRINLVEELSAQKKLINALRSFSDDQEADRILRDIAAKPFRRKKDCPLCPIWRHERETRLTLTALSRYVTPRVRDQLYLLTIVFDFAENLHQLEEQLGQAQKSMTQAVAHMGRKGHGVMAIGAFEFDLISHAELTGDKKSVSLISELGIVAPESGGWTLTGHFFIRAPHVDVLQAWLNKRFPSSTPRWNRVRFDKIHEDKELSENLSRILSYGSKMPSALFDVPTRSTKGQQRQHADAKLNNMATAFYGAFGLSQANGTVFDVNAAIVQWAKFIDRVGPKLMYYSIESTHAQMWLSDSEIGYLRGQVDHQLDLVEYRRDRCIPDQRLTHPKLVGKKHKIKSHPLTYDAEWVSMTDCSDLNSDEEYPDFTEWLMKHGIVESTA